MTPSEKRIAAIKALMALYFDEEGRMRRQPHEGVRSIAISKILELKAYGRAARWHTAIERWAGLVRYPMNDFTWAMLQGHMFAIWES